MKLYLIDSDQERLTQLGRGTADLRERVENIHVPEAIYTRPPRGMDAIFFTLPAAERWRPNFRARQMQIIATSGDDQDRGFPRFIVTGVNLGPDDPTDALSQVQIVLSEALEAVANFNEKNTTKIGALGFWVMDLTRGISIPELVTSLRVVLSQKSLT